MREQLGFSVKCLLECLEEDQKNDIDFINKKGETKFVRDFNIEQRNKAIEVLRGIL